MRFKKLKLVEKIGLKMDYNTERESINEIN